MITRRFLLLISCFAVLGGCIQPLEYRTCPDPGGTGNEQCFYHLTIINKGADPVVTAQVSKRVLEQENREIRSKLKWWDFSDYQSADKYPYHKFNFSVASGFNELVVGEDAWFKNVPGKAELIKCTPAGEKTCN